MKKSDCMYCPDAAAAHGGDSTQMSLLPLQVLGGLQLLGVAAKVPAMLESADFAGRLQRALHLPGGDAPSNAPASAGNGMDELQNRGLGNRIAAGLGNSISALRERNAALAGSFQQLLAGLLGENGLDFGEGVTLEQGESGQIEINGAHPDTSAIETLLNSTPDLRQLFNQIADNARLIHEFDEGRPPASFGRANGSQSRFRLFVDSSGSEGSFASSVTIGE